jgi:hypothetical protein
MSSLGLCCYVLVDCSRGRKAVVVCPEEEERKIDGQRKQNTYRFHWQIELA